ncbi:hypothetical protein HSISM1_1262 [Streptococcus sp. HSISM1]|nr:hypothetical protein HSISM1_1262 [Streptococcus sp. HSISM1]
MSKRKRSRSERRKAREKAQKEQMDSLTTFEGRKQFVQSKGLTNLVTRFKKGKGIKRNESKKTGEDIHLIHTDRTLHNYAGSWSRFAYFVAATATAEELEALEKSKNVDGWIDLVNQYLEHCKKTGLSAPTQSTYKTALAKVLGVSSTAFIATDIRYRANKRNNRLKSNDDRMSEETNNRWFSIVSATGLRKNELKAITGDSLHQREDGRYYLKIIGKKHKTKGARDRWVPIITRDKEELERLVEEFKLAGKKRVFQVPTALKPHKYRAEYAKRLYLLVARDLKDIKNKKKKFF